MKVLQTAQSLLQKAVKEGNDCKTDNACLSALIDKVKSQEIEVKKQAQACPDYKSYLVIFSVLETILSEPNEQIIATAKKLLFLN